MANIFMDKKARDFTWDNLGNIKEGRGDLGEDVPVLVYRMFMYSMTHVLSHEFGQDKCDEIFRAAGHLAGSEFAKNTLDLTLESDQFFAHLQQTLKDLKIGILRIENISEESGEIVLTVAQDLDCSGLPPTDEVVCNYDEGLLAGILETYTKKTFKVREIDCWANGDRVCRFKCEEQ